MAKKIEMVNPLQEYREKRGITIRQLAIETDLTQEFLNGFLNGKHRNLKTDTLGKIQRATKISLNKLFEYCDPFYSESGNHREAS